MAKRKFKIPDSNGNSVVLTGFNGGKAKTSGSAKSDKELSQGIDNKAFEHDSENVNEDGSKPSVSKSELYHGNGEDCCNGKTDLEGVAITLDEFECETPVTECENRNKSDEHTSDKAADAVEKEDNVSKSPASSQKVKHVRTSVKKFFTGTNFIVYISHFLSAWGDRMWSFGVGLFLVNIASENLQLPAVYGLSTSVTIFFLGALVGDWVDSTPRLKAAQLSLILQNVFVVICAGGVYAYLWFEYDITVVHGEWLVRICHAGIIVMGIFSSLASLARMIAVERDWIVEICGKDKDMLAKMTASLRRIDQGTLILAPIATGQIMTYAGLKNGAIFIAAWNVGSVFVEYYLMWKVYNTVPALRAKKGLCRADETPAIEADEEEIAMEKEIETSNKALSADASDTLESEVDKTADVKPDVVSDAQKDDERDSIIVSAPDPEKPEKVAAEEVAVVEKDKKKPEKKGCGNVLICSRFLTLYRGWKTYMRYSVVLAGLALACLYMTVLGFDNITVAYAVTQGVSESILGILMGVSAVFGILGTFAYPVFRRRLGLVRTGIFALSCEVACLSLCVVSVWMPGSPFDPLFYIRSPEQPAACVNSTGVQPTEDVKLPGNLTTGTYNLSISATASPVLNGTGMGNMTDCKTEPHVTDSYLSVGLLMAGIVMARFGLWIADLTITQLFLEAVVEGERGVVNGVQSSLNKLMDVLKFVLVVAVPDIETFGYLIVISFLFICLGWLLYAIFLRRHRGHFFHFEKCVGCNGQPNGIANGHTVSEPA